MKFFILCGVESGFILHLIVHSGTGTDTEIDKELGYSGSVVKKLLEPHLDKGCSLYVEGWYTSPKLFHYLYRKKTVRPDRKQMPVLPHVKLGDCVSYLKNNMLCVKWRYKRVVHVLITLPTNSLELPSRNLPM